MINRENNENAETQQQEQPATDTALVEVDAHILIRDLDTQEVLLNQRG